MPALVGAAQDDEVNLTVFDASAGMESGAGKIWKLILEDIAQKEHWSIDYQNGSLAEGVKRFFAGKIDVLTAVPHRNSGDVLDAMSQEAVISTWAQIYTRNDSSIQSFVDLDGHTVGVVRGDFYNSDSRGVLNGIANNLMLLEFKSGTELLQALEKGWIDAAVVDRFFGASNIHNHDVVKTAIVFSPIDFRFAVSPTLQHSVLNVLDYHLRAMKRDPCSIYHRFLDGIFGESKEYRLLTYFRYGLMAAVACLLAASIHVLTLRYRVKSRTAELASKNMELQETLVKMKEAERARRTSENRFYSLFHASPEGIGIHDIVSDASGRAVDYVITEVNPAYTQHTGLAHDQVIGRLASEVFGSAEPPYLKIFADTAMSAKPHQFETYFTPFGRHYRVAVYSPDAGQFATVFEDITNRKKAEEAIRTSEEKYRLLVDNAHDLIVVVQGGILKFANPAARSIFGYADDDLEKLPLSKIIHHEDRGTVLKLNLPKRDGAAQSGYHTFRALTKTGEIRWLQMNAVRVDWGNGDAALCIIRDITEAKKMENQLTQAQKMQAIGTLAGGVAHDFNNILCAIIGYTELCKMDIPEENGLHRNLNQILKAGTRARELVNQILTFSHQNESIPQPIEIKYCIEEALKLLRATIPSNIHIVEDIQAKSGIVMAEHTQIHQIIMNLCTNAAHAMQEEGGLLEICLNNCYFERAAAGIHQRLVPGSYIGLIVSDTGHGMTPETIQRIFEPYYTTKQKGEGTGLGLSMVHGIVESLHGAIKVYSEPGSGTTFNIYLPSTEGTIDGEVAAPHVMPGGCEKVLLVDDEEMVMDITDTMLTKMGYSVVSRTSSVEALKVFRMEPDSFDLVITDQTMPNITGKELAKRIMQVRPDLPIILCTGFSASINEEKAQAIGIRAFVKKPILQNELATVVRRVLDGR